jgi:predicted CXXCH cytochrome family protein
MRRRQLVLLFACLIVTALLFLGSKASLAQNKANEWGIAGFSKYVTIPGATRVGSEACAACHAETSNSFRHAFHAQQGIECEDCHGAGSAHVEGGGDVTKIISYKQRSARDANGACLSCHAQDEKVRHWLSGAHSANHVRCVDCHQVHEAALKAVNVDRIRFDPSTRGAFTAESVSPETAVVLRSRSETNEACLKCHQTEGAQLNLPYHHPLREAKMGCDDCHDPHGGPAGNNLRTARPNQLCLSCHAQYRGPFAYQHPPVTENCMLCHTPHGSPNTALLSVSEPALCLQCHAGHHDGASLPLADRCTNCHPSIHGTDTPTPSGGSRFVDKGPSERDLVSGDPPATHAIGQAHSTVSAASMMHPSVSPAPAYAIGGASGMMGVLAALGSLPRFSTGDLSGMNSSPIGSETGPDFGAFSISPGDYRFVHGSGYLGRVGEYDSLESSAGADASTAFVSTTNHLTVVSRGNIISGDDYSAASQITAGEWFQAGFDTRGFVQQQDHYPFFAFPVLDIIAGPPCNGVPCDTTTDLIPSQAVFGVKRRLGNAYGRVKVPKLPVHLFLKGNWDARVGDTQFAYLDENTLPITTAAPCGTQCHFQSQFQPVNYTTRDVGGGADIKIGSAILTWEHYFSSFNDRLQFPLGTFSGEFFPEDDSFGYSSAFPVPPGKGPTPGDVPIGPGQTPINYPVNIPAPNQLSSDTVSLNWSSSHDLTFNGRVSYARLRDLYTGYPQNTFETDETLGWRPTDRLRATADYHQQNVLNDFTPYYSQYGNVSYHDHWEGLRLEYELPWSFDIEGYYRRNGITRSNAFLWPQLYSVDNTDLMYVVPSSISNTTGLALRYHDHGLWSARAGYEWTGTRNPGYLIVPTNDNQAFADVWLTPVKWLVFSNDVNVIAQNAFPAVPLPDTPGATPAPPPATQSFDINIQGLPPTFQRRNRYYTETASATLNVVPDWHLGFGYSYQQNNMNTYMAFQNDSAAGYILDEPNVPYKQISQTYWGETTYTVRQRLGLSLKVTYNSARSGFRPDLNPTDAAQLGNQYLISTGAFNPIAFGTPGQPICPTTPSSASTALCNLQIAATQISQVIVPQWIGESKANYQFPHKVEGGLVFYYGSYRDQFNPNFNGVLRTFNVYVGRSW